MKTTHITLITAVALLAAGCPKGGGAPLAAAPPAIGAPADFSPPVPELSAGPGGSAVWLVARPELPLVSVRLVIPGGSSTDPAAQPGLASMADAALLLGAGERDAAAFAEAMALHAVNLDVSTGKRGTVISVDCKADQLDFALGLMADVVLRPRFDSAAVEVLRDERRAELTQAADEPRLVAALVADQVWFGAEDPRGRRTEGTVPVVSALRGEELRASWTGRAAPAGATFVVVGAADPALVGAKLGAHFGAWAGAPSQAAPSLSPPPAVVDGPRLTLVDNPGASQTVLRVVLPGWPQADADQPAGELGVIALGGTFTSRLNRLLREEKGYTYGARAAAESTPGSGRVIISTNVFLDKTGPALSDLLGEVKRFGAGIDAAELEKAKGSVRTDQIEVLGARSSIADTLVGLVLTGRGPGALREELSARLAVTEAAADASAARPRLDAAQIVVVGDLSKVEADVVKAVTEAAGAPPIVTRLDAAGQPGQPVQR